MQSLDDMSINEAIALYYEKHHALRQGNMKKLLEIKNKCPDLFDKKKEAAIREMIDYAKAFQASDRYKELCRLEVKEKLSIIKNEITAKDT
jgi:hypothetical protein